MSIRVIATDFCVERLSFLSAEVCRGLAYLAPYGKIGRSAWRSISFHLCDLSRLLLDYIHLCYV